MLNKLTKIKRCRLFPILVALYIAIGLPLVHPLIYRPWHDDHTSEQNHAHHRGAEGDHQESDCPLCDFISTSQWLATAFAPGTAINFQFGTFAPIYLTLKAEIGSRPSKPRAPPVVADLTKFYT
jgi:hypothetical protein